MPLGDGRSPRKLVDILRALPSGELDSLISRLGISIVAAKRIDTPSQVGRALVSLPEVRDPSRLPNASSELMHSLAEARGSLLVQSIPMGLEPLAAAASSSLACVAAVIPPPIADGPVEADLPHRRRAVEADRERSSSSSCGVLVQLRSWEGEDPRGIRALLAQAPFETVSAIATHYLGRPATPPIALSLEMAWEVLSDTTKLTEEIEKLAP